MNCCSFRIPASTSNLGAGFDALSLALDRYLKVTVNTGTSDFAIEVAGVDRDAIPSTQENLILRVAKRVAEQRGRKLPFFRMAIENEIPLARGMGSSAAAIIAGLTCYEFAAGERLSDQEFFQYAFEFEPHPDNLAAALRGGLVAAAVAANGEVLVSKLTVAPGSRAVVVVPDFELSTEKARAVLPHTYTRKDAVYNIQRAALTVACLTTGDWRSLREAMRDRIHQPYRAGLIPGFEEAVALQIPGLFGIALSGAGPTIFALAATDAAERVGAAIASVFKNHGVQATPHFVNIDTAGRAFD